MLAQAALIGIPLLMELSSILDRGQANKQAEKRNELALGQARQQKDSERAARAMLIDKMQREERVAKGQQADDMMRASLMQGMGPSVGEILQGIQATMPRPQMIAEPLSMARELGL